MKPMLRKRYWIELGAAGASAILFVVTLLWREWIEVIFGVDPDRGSGALEWLIVAALLALAVLTSALARYEWRRAAPA